MAIQMLQLPAEHNCRRAVGNIFHGNFPVQN